MKPYKIKHKPTGLYYKPNSGVCNLSKNGKVYLTGTNAITYYGGRNGKMYVEFYHSQNKKMFDILTKLYGNMEHVHPKAKIKTCIPMTDFEIEEL